MGQANCSPRLCESFTFATLFHFSLLILRLKSKKNHVRRVFFSFEILIFITSASYVRDAIRIFYVRCFHAVCFFSKILYFYNVRYLSCEHKFHVQYFYVGVFFSLKNYSFLHHPLLK
jgi:hypothetical protein